MPRSLVFILIILFQNFKFSALFSTDLEAHFLYKLDRGCKNVDIRFDSFYFYKLRNCDRVHGFLRISNLIFDETIAPFDIREITGYLLIENVQNLNKLSQILPNLTLIRGEKLYNEKYVINIVNNHELETDLNVIVYIVKGELRVENNSLSEIRSFPNFEQNFCTNSSRVFCWRYGEPPNLCNDVGLLDCPSKICRKLLVTSLSSSFESKTCTTSSYIPGNIELENRYSINSEDCPKIGRKNFQSEDCRLESQLIHAPEYYECDQEDSNNENCTIFINGTESLESIKKCSEPHAVEIFNLQEDVNQKLSDLLSEIIKIETCLIVSNSSAITNLHDLKKLKHICRGCEYNGSTYTVIIENNENLETLLPSNSEINLAQHKILITNNPKLKDTNGIFKCNFNGISVKVFARKDSALITTDLDMMDLYYESMGEIIKEPMQNNFIEVTNLSPDEYYKIFFAINVTTNSTENCSFKTMRRNEFIEGLEKVRNFTEIELSWKLTRDESFLKNEGYKCFMTYRNISKNINCHENQLQLPNPIKYEKFFMNPMSQNELDEKLFQSFAIENTSIVIENLDNSTCYRFEFLACIETNLILCEPSVVFYVRTLGDDEHDEATSDLIILLTSIIFLISLSVFVILFVRKKKKQKDEIIPIDMDEIVTLQIETKEVTILKNKVIGSGHFGKVYVGFLDGNEKTLYAIKVGNSCLNEEAMLMEKLNTHHIVKFIRFAFTEDNKPCLVMEYLIHGDLKTFLITNRPIDVAQCGNYRPQKFKTIRPVWEMAVEIADGMNYLADQGYIHNDLAARNCLVHQDFSIKIGDFGMARPLHDRPYYKPLNQKILPLRWLAPETLQEIPVFAIASDVYSYGVVLYELVTFCETPYSQFTDEQALAKIKNGEILEQPEKCDYKIYSLMKSCWKFDPSERKSFKEIIEFLLENFQIPEKFKSVSYYHTQM